MSDTKLSIIKQKIAAQHGDDEKQLEVVFTDNLRVIVEAPAGYGKTTTMISRIAYLFASGRIPNPKRILGLTFSVNAALKVKREVSKSLPSLLSSQNSPVTIGEKVTITNYHGFCKGILKKYGYLIADALQRDVNLFQAIGDSDIERQIKLKSTLTSAEFKSLKTVETSIKEAHVPDAQVIQAYSDTVTKKLLPLGYITHNAIILFVLEIFANYPKVKEFYQSYYPLIVVDEFQDTNCIAWELLKALISDQTQLLFLGDSLQRIYGFIGALPDIMSKAIEEYGMVRVALSRNYRFDSNPEMLKLDKNIRANAASCFKSTITEIDVAKLPAFWGITQKDEAEKVVAKVNDLMGEENTKLAILFRSRGRNAGIMEEMLTENHIQYFYGMFTDEDTEYIEFHSVCQEMFIKRFAKSKAINGKNLTAFSDSVNALFSTQASKTVGSLVKLLYALIEKVAVDYAGLVPEDKYTLLLDIFENRQLKQAMEYVDSRVILSTVHGAKGLEWDYVFVCDVEQWVFTYVCINCPSNSIQNGSACKLPQSIPTSIVSTLLDDFCVFYVALTRARKQSFISASGERFNASGRRFTGGKVCCFALVNGIKLVHAAPKIRE